VQLMATAGLRMLSNGSAEAVMAEVRAIILRCDTIGLDGRPVHVEQRQCRGAYG
jgi:hypothetical protein